MNNSVMLLIAIISNLKCSFNMSEKTCFKENWHPHSRCNNRNKCLKSSGHTSPLHSATADTSNEMLLSSEYIQEEAGHVKSCEYIGYVKSCEYVGYVKSCEYIGYVKSCEYIGYVKSCEYVGHVKSCEYVGHVKSCEYISYVKSCEYIGYVKSCEYIGYAGHRWHEQIPQC